MAKFKNLAAFVLSAALVLSAGAVLVACGGSDDDDDDTGTTIDYSSYGEDEWLAVDFDSKTISYQFTGVDSQFSYPVVLNLYDDGAACAEHLSSGYFQDLGGANFYYGYWSEAEDSDGNVITLDIIGCYGLTISYTMGYASRTESYTIYEESGGTYSVSFSIDLAIGMYTRTASLECDGSITYATFAALEAANPVETSDDDDDTDTDTDSEEATELTTLDGTFTTIVLYSDGTYVFSYATMGVSESGTWAYADGVLTLTTDGGNVYSSEDGSLSFTADISSQLSDMFTITEDNLAALA